MRASRQPRFSRTETRPLPTILLVDDEPAIQNFLGALLETRGYDVTPARTAQAAIELIETRPVDAIVLDVKMPGRSGLDVLRYVRERPQTRELPVFILTGAPFTPDEEALVVRYRAYVFYKQERVDELAEYIERLVARRRRGRPRTAGGPQVPATSGRHLA